MGEISSGSYRLGNKGIFTIILIVKKYISDLLK